MSASPQLSAPVMMKLSALLHLLNAFVRFHVQLACPMLLAFVLQLAPAASPIVSNNLLEHGSERAPVDLVALTQGNCAGRFVIVAARDDTFGIRDDRTVIEKDIDMV